MTISSGQVSLNDIQAEFGGSAPTGIFEYYQGGSIIGSGVYPNTIPTSGQIGVFSFRGAQAVHSYGGASSGNSTYFAQIGYSIDYFNNNKLRVTVGYWGQSGNSSTWTQLQLKSSSSSTPQYFEIAQFILTSANANTVQYGTIASGNMLYYGAQIYSNPVLAYGNNVNTTGGSSGAPGAAWMVAASWDGNNTVKVYLNPSRNGTGDTGSSISMSNLGSSINELNGGQGEGVPATFTLSR